MKGRKWVAALCVGAALIVVVVVATPLALGLYVNDQFQRAMASVPKHGDPWDSFQELREREHAVIGARYVSATAARRTMATKQRELLGGAIASGNDAALAWLFQSRQDATEDRFAELRASYRARLVHARERCMDAGVQNRHGCAWLLRAAADALAATDRAAALPYYLAAAAAGDTGAPLRVAQTYAAIGDRKNAYAWALRCTGACRREDFDLSTYQRGLPSADIAWAQGAAAWPAERMP